jgi:hypothetical protein
MLQSNAFQNLARSMGSTCLHILNLATLASKVLSLSPMVQRAPCSAMRDIPGLERSHIVMQEHLCQEMLLVHQMIVQTSQR